MPSTVRISPTDLVTTIRRLDAPKSWIDAYASHDDGKSWSFLSTPEPDTGEGNPPSLLRLADGRLCLIYGVRADPYGNSRPLEFRPRQDLGRRDHACATTAARPTSATSARSSGPTARLSPSIITTTARTRSATSRRRSGGPGRRELGTNEASL